MDNFADYLKTTAGQINQELSNFLTNWQQQITGFTPQLSSLHQAFAEANLGGSRLRGVLVKLGYELAGGQSLEILQPAIAYEIFQTAILAHDDIIDRSRLRRGKPALWQALGGNHYGLSQAICLGDMGFFLAQKLITESNFPDDSKNKALQCFVQTVLETATGEMLDVALPTSGREKSEAEILTLFKLKTAHYTVIGPLSLGVILAAGSEKLLKQIQEYGENLGIAFQIQDDILGIFGEEKVTGKSITSDAEEGKHTLLILSAKQKADSKQQKVLNSLYGKGKISLEELEQIRQIFTQTGALSYSQKKADQLVKKAKDVVVKMEINSHYQQLLLSMADLLVARER
ncbi:polyprenyl synthetase family protein [Patescibacteria group bacterium]|nr:polyprenyl synthetase family protein [Patescibacteria group bacterium]MCL5409385.1 polyprenyl synthetase family protein [Patescibacteria group bacterium]